MKPGFCMIAIALLASLLFTSLAFAAEFDDVDPDCGAWRVDEGKVFTLGIDFPFGERAAFKLCKKSDNYFLAMEASSLNSESIRKTINLNPEQARELIASYENALKFNALDNVAGLDGSLWCIETRRGFTRINACFWNPGTDPDERGLLGLYNLGSHLWQLAELGQHLSLD